jgi:hypothetical protein
MTVNSDVDHSETMNLDFWQSELSGHPHKFSIVHFKNFPESVDEQCDYLFVFNYQCIIIYFACITMDAIAKRETYQKLRSSFWSAFHQMDCF